ncbi:MULTISPECIES: OmpA family protein [unclassified Neisseria]|uniref:OmpA family protein n=1 Tax=unclassified Neisseria TaxID=2623750 RepID=UPI0026664125|nr:MULTISPECIES: OmpA family protein [unclassified Neisseria]MDO1510548.1 OmpA family protein [Neisseria sp. MVDL19-042950]MDO1516341.1 OmpA family protein [Neisseria sp. MVDL18-041461]MDO1564113.1 OmpA family protein [Neisseria sp. MVDL20-010259]
MFQYRKLLWVLLPLTAVGCAHHPKESWVDTKQAAYSTSVPDNRSSVVFYRQANAVNGPTVNIYVNGQYSGSLQPNAYRQEVVCAQNQRFHAEFTKRDAGYLNKANAGDYYNLPDSAVSFFKIIDDGAGNPVLQAVSPEQAEVEMKGVKRQNHTLSRVVSKEQCAVILKKYSLQASALFEFDRSDFSSVLPKGKQELAVISEDIKQNPDHISGIAVVGHADPEGSPEYNRKLSVERAATVKTALSESGLDRKLISAEGRGERELVIKNCRKKYPNNAKARQECDQPNRRVEVILHGEKK